MALDFVQRLGLSVPLIQAPMAGTSTPDMAAAVSEAGALGSISIGAMDVNTARQAIRQVREATDRPFNVNVFCHRPPTRDADVEAAWLTALRPSFALFNTVPPKQLHEIYRSFAGHEDMLELLFAARPPVVSFHFGLPAADMIDRLHAAGIFLLSTATNLSEALAAAEAGVDGVVAQGIEAGGHRGVFDPDATDPHLGTFPLVRLLVDRLDCPIIAAGGIMDGAGIAAALDLGAQAAQLGTAFIGCPESAADAAFRAALFSDAARHTVLTRAISGRPARCLRNAFTALSERLPASVPAYPVAYDAGKQLNAAAVAAGEGGFGAQWAGQGAPLARALPAGELVMRLSEERAATRRSDVKTIEGEETFRRNGVTE